MSEQLTVNEAAKRLAQREGKPISAVYVRKLCQRGVFPHATKPGRDWLIPENELNRWQPSKPGRKPQKEQDR